MFDITKMVIKGTNLKEPIYFPIEEQMAKTFYEYALIAVYPCKVFITKEVEKLAADVINAGFDSYKVFNALRIRGYKFDDVGNEYVEFLHIEEAKEVIRKLTASNQAEHRELLESEQIEHRELLESGQEGSRMERFLQAIMRAYHEEDLCMEDLLDGTYANFSVSEMANIYAKTMHLANGDKTFIIKEDKRHPMWLW